MYVRSGPPLGMDATDTIAAVEEATTTERSRLGSDKALIAATGADLSADAIWAAAATRESGLADALDSWVSDAGDDAVTDAFDRAGQAAADRAARIGASPGDPDALSTHLGTLEGTPARVGAGLVAPALVLDRFYLQVVSFFVNEADEGSADVVRALRSEASDLDSARDALAALGESERERAQDAAVEAVGVAYDEYASTLDSMGLDPKPVC